MPPRDLPFGHDPLVVPCCLAKGLDDPVFLEWARDHPDWFVAGTWTTAAPPGPADARPGTSVTDTTADPRSPTHNPAKTH